MRSSGLDGMERQEWIINMACPWCDEKCRPIDWWFAGRRANLQGNVFLIISSATCASGLTVLRNMRWKLVGVRCWLILFSVIKSFWRFCGWISGCELADVSNSISVHGCPAYVKVIYVQIFELYMIRLMWVWVINIPPPVIWHFFLKRMGIF